MTPVIHDAETSEETASRIVVAARAQLDEVMDPCSVGTGTPMSVIELGLVDDVRVDAAGEVRIDLRLTSPFCEMIGFFVIEAKRRIEAIDGVASVIVDHDSGMNWAPTAMSPTGQSKREQHLLRLGIPRVIDVGSRAPLAAPVG